mgnify:CR=1 FL=1
MNRIYLYGIAGASDKYAVIRYSAIDVDYRPIDAIKMEADIMRMDYPSVKKIFAIDARGGLANDYRRAIKSNTIESYIIFKDILES